MSELTENRIWQALEEVPDPEIPVLSVIDLGIVRRVSVEDGRIRVAITPTFAGCPALDAIRRGIRERLEGEGAEAVEVETVLSPPWSTDDLSEAARRKLRSFGLTPPPRVQARVEFALEAPAACPYCGSHDSELKNAFGSTPCRTIHVCHACRQPFEAMKPL
jgi:ring-1,2-phenylacetyl-CoA epoxidase subunit PaaD